MMWCDVHIQPSSMRAQQYMRRLSDLAIVLAVDQRRILFYKKTKTP